MEKRSDVRMSLTPEEAEELRKFIKENRHFPSKLGYILLEEKPLRPNHLYRLLVQEGFDDMGVFLVFRGGMSENSVRLFLEHTINWDAGRIDQAITRAKLYYFYYSQDWH